MKVRMKVSVTGTRDGQYWPPAGGIVAVPDYEGRQLCEQGLAEPVAQTPVERAEQRGAAPERAAKPRRKR